MYFKFSVAAICLSLFSAAAQPKVSEGALKHFDKFDSKLVEPRPVDVWLPEGYSTDKKYAVLYMHDGQMLFDASTTWNKQSWEASRTASGLMEAKQTRDFIIVGIYNVPDLRFSDYFPQKPFESLTQKTRDSIYDLYFGEKPMFSAKVNSDNYLKFIVSELKPFIDKTYSVKTDRDNTFIAGSSMGGLISMYAICEYPEVFGGAACLSTHWTGVMGTAENPVPGAFLKYMDKKLPSPKTHKLYFDLGTETLDANYGPSQARVDGLMAKHGFTKNTNWKTAEFPGDDHSEKSWAARLAIPLNFLMGDGKLRKSSAANDAPPKNLSKKSNR